EHDGGGTGVIDGGGAVFEAQGAEAPLAAGPDGASGRVEGQIGGGFDVGRENLFDGGAIDGACGADEGAGGGAGHFGDDEEFFAREAVGFVEPRLTAIGEAETAGGGLLGDAIGIGAGEMAAEIGTCRLPCPASRFGPAGGEGFGLG